MEVHRAWCVSIYFLKCSLETKIVFFSDLKLSQPSVFHLLKLQGCIVNLTQTLTAGSFAAPCAAQMCSISFECQGPVAACLVKSMAALLRFDISTQSAPIYIVLIQWAYVRECPQLYMYLRIVFWLKLIRSSSTLLIPYFLEQYACPLLFSSSSRCTHYSRAPPN